MASTTIQVTTDAWVEQDAPAANHGFQTLLSVNGDASHGRRAYLWFAPPFDLGSTVNNASLGLYLNEAWSGSTTITAKRVTTVWGDDTVTWTNKPTTTATNQATAVVSSGAAGALVTFNITAMMGDVSGGADFYGIELTSSSTTTHNFTSTNDPSDNLTDDAIRPYCTLDFGLEVLAPVNLAPDGNYAVSSNKPVVAWDFASDDDDRSQSASIVQLGTVADFSSVEFTSGTVANVISNYDLSTSAYGGVPSGQSRYWRVAVVDDLGRVTPFSDVAQFSYSPLGTYTLTTPAAVAGTGPVGSGILDDFNRANTGPPPSASWTSSPTGWKVVSNAAVTGAAGFQASKWTAGTFAAPVEAFATLTTLTGTYEFDLELATDFDTTGNGYGAVITNTGSTEIHRIDAGVETTLSSTTISWASGNKIGLSIAEDGTVRLWRDSGSGWTMVLTASDDTYQTALFPIIVANNTSLVLDNFGGGDTTATVDETTPGIAWTLTGTTQSAVELVLVQTGTRAPDESDDVQPADPNEDPLTVNVDSESSADGSDGDIAAIEDVDVPLELWRFPKTLTTAGTVNVPEDLIRSDGIYQIRTANYDTVSREAVISSDNKLAVSRTFTYKRAGGVTAVTDLSLSRYPSSSGPGVMLDWTDGGTPADWWSIRVDGAEVIQRLLPVNTLYGVAGGGAGKHHYLYWGSEPGSRHRYVVEGVKVVGNHKKHSRNNKRRYASMLVVGIWLVDTGRDLSVMIRGTDAPDLSLREVGTTYDIVGSENPVRIIDSSGGYSGTVSGFILGAANRSRFKRLKGVSRGKRLRLIFSDLNIPVRLEETSIAPAGDMPPGYKRFDVSFSFFQDGEVSFKPGSH